MLPVPFDDISSADVLKLVEEKTSERKTLEYKAQLNIGTGDEKAEFLADISSFANAAGGDIIFGISDERDEEGKATGIPGTIVPLSITNAETERGRISQLIETGIQPRIPGIQVKVVLIPEAGPVIVIRVPKSWIAPHMVSYANRTRFFSRNNIVGKLQLDVQQIGAAYAQQRGLGERLRSWKADRIGKAIAGEGPVPMEGSQILYHFVTASTLTDDAPSLPRSFDIQKLFSRFRLLYTSPQSARYNADGVLVISNRTQNNRQSYLQVFRDGSLEYGDSLMFDDRNGNPLPSQIFEQKIVERFADAVSLLKELESPEPIFVAVTLLNMKGRNMALPNSIWDYTSAPFDRDTILSPDMLIENLRDNFPHRDTLLPIVNSIWQAAGIEETPYLGDGYPMWKQTDA
jgi:hypothetical protein